MVYRGVMNADVEQGCAADFAAAAVACALHVQELQSPLVSFTYRQAAVDYLAMATPRCYARTPYNDLFGAHEILANHRDYLRAVSAYEKKKWRDEARGERGWMDHRWLFPFPFTRAHTSLIEHD